MKIKINSPLTAISIIILSTVCIIVSFSDYSYQIKQTLEDEMHTNLSVSTHRTVDKINVKFKNAISAVKTLSQTISARGTQLEDIRILTLLNQAKALNDFSLMAVALPDGTCYLSDGRKAQITDRPYFKKAMANNIVISNVEATRPDGNSSMMITVPVCRNFKVVGTVNAAISMGTINELLGADTSEGQGITCIVEQSGKVISTSLPQYANRNIFNTALLSFEQKDDTNRIKMDAANDKSGSVRYYSDECEYYAYYAPIGINDWYIVNTTQTNVATFESDQILKSTGILAAKIAAALFLLGVYAAVCGRKNRRKLRQANEVLSRTNVELETFVANVPGGAFRYSADEKAEIQFVSEGLLKMFGYTKDEFYKQFDNTFHNMICEEDRTKTLNNIKQQVAKGNFAEVKYRIITADGRTRWLLNRTQIVAEENGYSEFCAVVVDITDSKQAHKRASDAMAQLQTLSNSISGGVAQFLYDGGNLTLMYASEGFYKLSGQSKEEYARNFNSGGILCAFSEDQAGLQFTINRQIAKQAPLDAEYRLVQKDGKIIWISLSGTPTVNRYNQVIYQCIFTDITSFKKTQEELELERERYQIAENLSDDIMFEYDIVTDYMEFSPLFTALTGQYPHFPNFLQDIAQNDSFCSTDLPEFKAYFKELGLGNSDANTEFRCKARSGEYIWHKIKAKVIFDPNGKSLKAVGKAYNIDVQKTELQRLTDKSQRDSLTNLFNKVSTQSQIEDDLKELGTGGKHAFIVIDIDNFKAINDSYGHLIGDSVITDISTKMQMLFRTSDVVGRIGGDEFVVFLRGVSSDNLIMDKAKAICDIFRNTHPGNHTDYRISASLGIALYPTDGTTYQELFPKADLALYRAKSLGKDCYAFYSDELDSNSKFLMDNSQ